MKKSGKRVLAWTLTLAMLVALLPMSVLAAGYQEDDFLDWKAGTVSKYVLTHKDESTQEETHVEYDTLQAAWDDAVTGDTILTPDSVEAQYPALNEGEDYAGESGKPGCTGYGTVKIKNSDTGETRYVDTEPMGHCYELTVTKPTCEKGGSLTGTCIRCNRDVSLDATYAAEIDAADLGEATGHTYNESSVTWGSWVEANSTRWTEMDPLSAAEGAYDVSITATFECSVCNKSQDATVEVTGELGYTSETEDAEPRTSCTDSDTGAYYTFTATASVTDSVSGNTTTATTSHTITGAGEHLYDATITYYKVDESELEGLLTNGSATYNSSTFTAVDPETETAGDAIIRVDSDEDGVEDTYYIAYMLEVTCERCGATHHNTNTVHLAKVVVEDEYAETPLCANRKGYLVGEDKITADADITLGNGDGDLTFEVTIPALDPLYETTDLSDGTGAAASYVNNGDYYGNVKDSDYVNIEWTVDEKGENPSVTVSFICQYCGQVHENDVLTYTYENGNVRLSASSETVAANCTESGNNCWVVDNIPVPYTDDETIKIKIDVETPATGHTQDETAAYGHLYWVIDGEVVLGDETHTSTESVDWQAVYDNNSTVQVAPYYTCTSCEQLIDTSIRINAEQVIVQEKDVNCTKDGSGYYYAVVEQPNGAESRCGSSSTTDFVIEKYGQHTVTMDDVDCYYWDEPVCDETGNEWTVDVHFVCSRCEEASWLTRTVTLDTEVLKDPTCEGKGLLGLTGTYTIGGPAEEGHSYEEAELTYEGTVPIEPTGHSYSHGENYRGTDVSLQYRGDQDDDNVRITWIGNEDGTAAEVTVSFCCKDCREWTEPVTYQATKLSSQMNKEASCGDGLQWWVVYKVPVCGVDKDGNPLVNNPETVDIGAGLVVPGTGEHVYKTNSSAVEGVDYIYTPAGCEHDGTITFVCTVCGYEHVVTPDDPEGDNYGLDRATGHNYEWYWNEADCCYPTFGIRYCTNYWDAEVEFGQDYAATVCENPIERWTSTGDVDMTNHRDLQESVIREATCQRTGLVFYWCDDCGYESYETTPTIGHALVSQYTRWVINGKEYQASEVTTWPTEGVTLRVYYTCSVCGEIVSIDYEAELNVAEGSKATCTADGTGEWSCTFPQGIDGYNVGSRYLTRTSGNVTIPATKHTVDEDTVTWTVHYDTENKSYYAEVNWDCVCEDHSTQAGYHTVTLTIDEDKSVAPTCESDGYVVFEPAEYVEGDTSNWNGAELKSETWGELRFDNTNQEFSSNPDLAKTGHSWTYKGNKLVTKEESGWSHDYYACSGDTTSISDDAVEVNWKLKDGVPVAATITYICQHDCGETSTVTYDSDNIEVGEYPENPTCIKDGYKYWVIHVCDKEGTTIFNLIYAVTLPATDKHVFSMDAGKEGVYWMHVDANCTHPGYVIMYCQGDPNCTETEIIYSKDEPALGHNWVDYYQDADCIHGNLFITYCSRCGEIDEDLSFDDGLINPNHHAEGYYTEKVARDATCTENGLTFITCTACGYKGYADIPATGHDLYVHEGTQVWYVQDLTTGEMVKVDSTYKDGVYVLNNNGGVITLDNYDTLEVHYQAYCTMCGESVFGVVKVGATVDGVDSNCGDANHDDIISYTASDTQYDPITGEEFSVSFAAQVEIDDVAAHHTNDNYANWGEPYPGADGNWYIDVSWTCADCGHSSSTYTEELTIADTVPATCTEDGLITFETVTHQITFNTAGWWENATLTCGSPTYVIPATGHTYSFGPEFATAATVTEDSPAPGGGDIEVTVYEYSGQEITNDCIDILWAKDGSTVTLTYKCVDCGEQHQVTYTYEDEEIELGTTTNAGSACGDSTYKWYVEGIEVPEKIAEECYDANGQPLKFAIIYTQEIEGNGEHDYSDSVINWWYSDTGYVSAALDKVADLSDHVTKETLDDVALHIRILCNGCDLNDGHREPEVTRELVNYTCNTETYLWTATYTLDSGDTFTFQATATVSTPDAHHSFTLSGYTFVDETRNVTNGKAEPSEDLIYTGSDGVDYVNYCVTIKCDGCDKTESSEIRQAVVVYPEDWHACNGGTVTLEGSYIYDGVEYNLADLDGFGVTGLGHIYSIGPEEATHAENDSLYKYYDDVENDCIRVVWASDYTSADVSFKCQDCGEWSDPVTYTNVKLGENGTTYTPCGGGNEEWYITGITLPEDGRIAEDSIDSGTNEQLPLAIYADDEEPAIADHTWDWAHGVHSAATCTEPETVTYYCSVCGETQVDEISPALGHDFRYVKTVTPTCKGLGYDLYECSRCGEKDYRNLQAIDPDNHVPNANSPYVLTPATCTEAGLQVNVCELCGYRWYEVIEPTGHDYSKTQVHWYYGNSNEYVSAELDENLCAETDLNDYVTTADDAAKVDLKVYITCANGCDLNPDWEDFDLPNNAETYVTVTPEDCNTETWTWTVTYTLEETGAEFTFVATATVTHSNAYHVYTGPITFLYYLADKADGAYSSANVTKDLTDANLIPVYGNEEDPTEVTGYQVRYTVRAYCENCDAHFTYTSEDLATGDGMLYAQVVFDEGCTCEEGSFTLNGEPGTYHGIPYDVTDQAGGYEFEEYSHVYAIDETAKHETGYPTSQDEVYEFCCEDGELDDGYLLVTWADDYKSVDVQFVCQHCGGLSEKVTYVYTENETSQILKDEEDSFFTTCGGGENAWYVNMMPGEWPTDGTATSVEGNNQADGFVLYAIEELKGDGEHDYKDGQMNWHVGDTRVAATPNPESYEDYADLGTVDSVEDIANITLAVEITCSVCGYDEDHTLVNLTYEKVGETCGVDVYELTGSYTIKLTGEVLTFYAYVAVEDETASHHWEWNKFYFVNEEYVNGTETTRYSDPSKVQIYTDENGVDYVYCIVNDICSVCGKTVSSNVIKATVVYPDDWNPCEGGEVTLEGTGTYRGVDYDLSKVAPFEVKGTDHEYSYDQSKLTAGATSGDNKYYRFDAFDDKDVDCSGLTEYSDDYIDVVWTVDPKTGEPTAATLTAYCQNGCDIARTVNYDASAIDYGQHTVEATCGDDGYDYWVVHVFSDDLYEVEKTDYPTDVLFNIIYYVYIPATKDHPLTGSTIVDHKDATCTEGGYYIWKCGECGHEFTTSDGTAATGHAFYSTGVVIQAATCDKVGYELKTCAVCGATELVEIPATGHNWTVQIDWNLDGTTASYTAYCSVCGAVETGTPMVSVKENGDGTITYTATVIMDNGQIFTSNSTVFESSSGTTEPDPEPDPEPGVTVDKSALEAAIATARSLDSSVYTEESWAALEAALAAALAIDAEDSASQTSVNLAAAALNSAISALELAPTEPNVDKTALEAAIAAAEALDAENYTKESWAEVAEDLANAREIYADANASQSSVNAATRALESAIAALEHVTTCSHENLTYEIEWAEDYASATLTITCEDCGEVVGIYESTNVTGETDGPTCTVHDVIYTVTFEGFEDMTITVTSEATTDHVWAIVWDDELGYVTKCVDCETVL